MLSSRSRLTFSLRFIQFYFVVGVLILGGVLFIYTRFLMRQLESETQVRSRIYARFMTHAADAFGGSSPELDIIFDEVVKKIDFPVIVTDSAGNPLPGGYRNLPEKKPSEEELRRLIRRLDSEHPPITLFTMRGADTVRLQQIHYGLSRSARIVRMYPYLQLLLLVLFLPLGIWALYVYHRRERERIWTALAKETAHQLATPLSSFGAWLDVLRHRLPSAPAGAEADNAITELSRDLARMEEVLERFSRIGHTPELKPMPITPIVEQAVAFVRRRASRVVEFELNLPPTPAVNIDQVLISWTVENLLRNSVDAIGRKPGRITVTTSQQGSSLEISVTDTGDGIAPEMVRTVFKPGVTTKKYGWGVGLTLAKRIVEEYHSGRLIVKESRPGQTTFAIVLPIAGLKEE